MYQLSTIAERMSEVRGNPAAIQRISLNLIEKVTNGEAVVFDSTSSFANALECAACSASAGMTLAETLLRQAYPALSVTDADNYRHMADDDFDGIFSTPANAEFILRFNYRSLLNAAVPDTLNPDIKKVIIPRYSEVTNGVHKFTLHYPLVIRIYPNNAIQVMWDIAQTSPIDVLENTYIRNWIRTIDNVAYVCFSISLKQMVLTSVNATVSSVGGHNKSYSFSGQFYYCRAFIKNVGQSNWTEISTTHNDSVYDPNKPTMLLRVSGNNLSTSLPLIYTSNGLVNNAIRIDIFSCSGELNYLMDGFSDRAFNIKWTTQFTNASDTKYTAPLDSLGINSIAIMGNGAVKGGTNGKSTAEIRDTFINRASSASGIIITPAQIRDRFTKMGYDLVMSVDNISNRVYLATSDIPANLTSGTATNNVVSGMGMTVGLLKSNINKLAQNAGIKDNGSQITILPSCLFNRIDGILSIVPTEQLSALLDRNQTTVEEMAAIVNANEYLFSPFHYRILIDATRMYCQAYHLTSPGVTSKRAVLVNEAALIAGSTNGYAIAYRKANDGYTLALELTGDTNFLSLGKDRINLQLSYIADNGGARKYINGELVSPLNEQGVPASGNWVYWFHIPTSFEIDVQHRLVIDSDGGAIELNKEFDIAIVVKDHLPVGASGNVAREYYNASKFANYQSSSTYLAVSHEKITLKLGDYLEGLWSRYRTVPEETEYLTYSEDVPLLYDNNVLERNEFGLPILTFNSQTGKYEANILHRAGDVQLDDEGNPIIKYYAGDFRLDQNGDPIIKDGQRGLQRQVELVLFDGKYFFANDNISVQYRTDATTALMSWIVNDIPKLQEDALERTYFYFYPKVNMDYADVVVDDGDTVKIYTAQNVAVDYYLTEDRFNNVDLKESMIKSTPAVLLAALSKQTVSILDIQAALKKAMGDDVISVKVSGLFNDQYNTVTMNDPSMTLGIGKLLTVQSNMSLQVEDAIDVRFHNHSKKTT